MSFLDTVGGIVPMSMITFDLTFGAGGDHDKSLQALLNCISTLAKFVEWQ